MRPPLPVASAATPIRPPSFRSNTTTEAAPFSSAAVLTEDCRANDTDTAAAAPAVIRARRLNEGEDIERGFRGAALVVACPLRRLAAALARADWGATGTKLGLSCLISELFPE